MTTAQHLRRLGLLIAAAAALLWWLAAHTDVFFADGLRYIAQAKTIDHGSRTTGLIRSVDHPIYPMAIAAVHRLLGGDDPRDWQAAAQVAAAIAGVLLVIPIYLINVEIFGPSSAWLACFLIYLLPFNGHVLADALSESTFLLFWSWGLWSTLKFLRSGGLVWLPLLVAFSVIAYLTRPEGLILPVALMVALLLLPLFDSEAIPRTKRWWAIGVLVVGPILMAGPFMVMKGGISTKPSILRILGLGRAAPAMAVERERPLDPEQTTIKTIGLAARAMTRAVEGATSLPLLVLAPLGIAASWSSPARRRYLLLLGVIVGLSGFAMIRLHTMSGYCTPRHAMVVAWILIPASAAGLNRLAATLARAMKKLAGKEAGWPRLESAIRLVCLGCCLTLWGPAAIASIDPGFHGYRQAGEWLALTARPGEVVVDPKGFSLFYAGKLGYTFATLAEGVHDPKVRWVVAHESLIFGPWDYSKVIRTLVADRRPIRIFPAKPAHRVSKVYVYDLAQPGARTAGAVDQAAQSRR
jgi:Dolichyl-phosphate-mannose-protein mannosyltransferase